MKRKEGYVVGEAAGDGVADVVEAGLSEQFLNGTSAQNRPFQCHDGAKSQLTVAAVVSFVTFLSLHP